MSVIPDQLLTRKEVAEILKIKEKTLRNWKSLGYPNLEYTKIGRLIRYNSNDIEKFISKQR